MRETSLLQSPLWIGRQEVAKIAAVAAAASGTEREQERGSLANISGVAFHPLCDSRRDAHVVIPWCNYD